MTDKAHRKAATADTQGVEQDNVGTAAGVALRSLEPTSALTTQATGSFYPCRK